MIQNRKVDADTALSRLESGMRVYIHPGCAEPEALVDAMMRRGPQVRHVEVTHLLTLGKAPYADPEWAEHFRHRSLFTGKNVREALNNGRADYVPVFLHEIPRLFRADLLPIDMPNITFFLVHDGGQESGKGGTK